MSGNGPGPRPTLWRTCRALANETRLKAFRWLLRNPDQTVSRVASKLGLSRSMATRHLRILAARGLLRASRIGPWVCYRVEPDPTIPEARRLVAALRDAFSEDPHAVEGIYRLATAFTNARRQAVYEELRKGDRTFADLVRGTRMSPRALGRHLAKLQSRGFVVAGEGLYRAAAPPGRVARILAELAPGSAR